MEMNKRARLVPDIETKESLRFPVKCMMNTQMSVPITWATPTITVA